MIDNFWIDYFLIYKDNLKQNNKENWIDLETEIGNVVKELENNMTGFEDIAIDKLTNIILKKFIEKNFDNNQCMTFREITDILYNDLNKLIRLLEIYLSEYVEKIEIKKKVPEINVLTKIDKTSVSVDMPRVICFNYTHTYQNVYFSEDVSSYVNYVHGEVDKGNTIESNNMVLGIDEYLKKKDRNKKIEFIGFKKFFQRIYKGTGCDYKIWIETIKKDDLEYHLKISSAEKTYAQNINSKKKSLSVSKHNRVEKEKIRHHVYFFGHSLDVTDKDIIRDLILSETVHTTIYYYAEYDNDKRDLYQKIANLNKIIGQKNLIRKTGGSVKTIEFVPQKM